MVSEQDKECFKFVTSISELGSLYVPIVGI